MIRTFLTIILLAGFIKSSQAQLISDILRYSYTEDFGSARSLAIGNSIAALGGDFYTLANNPAGIATYRFSEFNLSTGLRGFRTESALDGNGTFSEVDNDLVLNSLGMVITHNAPQSDWRTVNFGIGYNRNTSLDHRSYYQGSSRGSITDRWLERAQGDLWNDLSDFDSGLAFDAGAIYPFVQDQDNGQYASDYELISEQELDREENTSTVGGMGEFAFGFGANYRDKLYIGASFGIPLIEYDMRRSYRETNPQPDENAFRSLVYQERLNTSGEGINAKLGLIYLFSQSVRWSFHYESGSRISVIDEFSNSLEYAYDEGNGTITGFADFPGDGGTLNAEYSMITPYQLTTGLSILAGKRGFITTSIDFSDYRHARFIFDRDLATDADLAYERELNQAIDDVFTSGFTFRVGGELAMESFRLRAGGVAKQRPFANDNGFDYGYSAGLGIRIKRVFFDLAFRRFHEFSTYQPYLISNTEEYAVQNVDTEDIFTDVVLTFGVKF